MAAPLRFYTHFRAVHDWLVRIASRGGWGAIFPTFVDFRGGDDVGAHLDQYMAAMIRSDAVEWRDVPAAHMGYPAPDPGSRLRAAHEYAKAQGYAHGYPTFHQADYGQGTVYGTWLIRPGFVEWRDVPTTALGFTYPWLAPTYLPIEWWFQSANAYADRHGYAAGMPNGHYAKYGPLWMIGVHLFRHPLAYKLNLTRGPLGYEVERAEPPGDGGHGPVDDGVTPEKPTSGSETVSLEKVGEGLSYETTVGASLDGRSNDAIITSVKNTSDYDYILSHGNVAKSVGKGDSVTEFNDIPIMGDWYAKVDWQTIPPTGVGVLVGWKEP